MVAEQKKVFGADADDIEEAGGQEEEFKLYTPLKFKLGQPHPDALIQSANLAVADPPDVHYHLHLPPCIIKSGTLSNPQLETIVYASQKFEEFLPNGTRKGFFLGDGAGVGKGRQLSGLVLENWAQDRKKSIWLSASADLHLDARRDLDDVGAEHIQHFCLKDMNYEMIKYPEGVLFATYTSLVSASRDNKKKNRLEQLVKWVGGDAFDGCIFFDGKGGTV